MDITHTHKGTASLLSLAVGTENTTLALHATKHITYLIVYAR